MFCFCLFLTTRLFSQMDERHPSKVYHRFYARLELVKLRHFVYPSPNFYGSHKVQNLGSVDMLWFGNRPMEMESGNLKHGSVSTDDFPIHWVRQFSHAYPNSYWLFKVCKICFSLALRHRSFETKHNIWNLKCALGALMIGLCLPQIWQFGPLSSETRWLECPVMGTSCKK